MGQDLVSLPSHGLDALVLIGHIADPDAKIFTNLDRHTLANGLVIHKQIKLIIGRSLQFKNSTGDKGEHVIQGYGSLPDQHQNRYIEL